MNHPVQPVTPPERFADVVALLREGLAELGGRRILAGTLVLRLWTRFGKMSIRFAALFAYLAEFGADPPHKPRKPRVVRPKPPPPPPPPPPDRGCSPPWAETPWGLKALEAKAAAGAAAAARQAFLDTLPKFVSRRFGWLPSLDLRAAAAGSRLRFLFDDPQMVAMLAISPRMRKLVGPLARMLGVKLPPVPRAPRKVATTMAVDADATATADTTTATDTEPASESETDEAASRPRRRRRRLWRPPSRRSDMMTLLRMGTPLVEN